MNTYGVIMAGGGGTRFWPLSRQSYPKQFLNLTGKERMVNETADRLAAFIEKENLFVVTNQVQAREMTSIVKGRIQENHVLSEPASRNTAACIGYAAMEILRKYGDGIMVIVPSDAYIKDEKGYAETLQKAVKVAEETDKLVTIGIKPTFPCTGYGYIRTEGTGEALSVVEFVEKPNLETAEAYLKAGTFSWNSGMFIWKASVIMSYFEKLLPDIYEKLQEIATAMKTTEEASVIQEVYPTIPKISVDYGIMERADGVLMLQGDFGWNDVGSWDALNAIYDEDENGNILRGEHFCIDTTGCITYSEKRLIATVGVENLIIVDTPDAIMVCDKSRAQDVKQIVEGLKEEGKTAYL